MGNRLANAISPYLRAHADNPVDWYPWGQEAFDEAARRNVPLFISIGYSTCHWCHVMARESFSDEVLAAYLNEHFVAIKVDREEHPDVDAAYMAAASAFTENLGWPLSVFATPDGHAFYAGSYFPPHQAGGHPGFDQVMGAVTDAWMNRRDKVLEDSLRLTAALAEASKQADGGLGLPTPEALSGYAGEIASQMDLEFGGFGTEPKFPLAPVLEFLLSPGSQPDRGHVMLATHALKAMSDSPLRDAVEGGFFRYATRRDWSVPHYERMLYDNAGLLAVCARLVLASGSRAAWVDETARGIVGFLANVMRREGGGFGAAQDSESVVDGARTEGGYYGLDAASRANQTPPWVDDKVLAGWNGLAIGALAQAATVFAEPGWVTLAKEAADYLLRVHVAADGMLYRVSVAGAAAQTPGTLEDYGMLAGGLFRLALAAGEASYAVAARELLQQVMVADPHDESAPFALPGGADPLLAASGLHTAQDASEGSLPSGTAACSEAALLAYQLTGDRKFWAAAAAAVSRVAAAAKASPLGYGASLRVAAELATEGVQLVVVTPDGPPPDALQPVSPESDAVVELVAAARELATSITAVVDSAGVKGFADAGFGLFSEKITSGRDATAYLCRNFACRLPVTTAGQLKQIV